MMNWFLVHVTINRNGTKMAEDHSQKELVQAECMTNVNMESTQIRMHHGIGNYVCLLTLDTC